MTDRGGKNLRYAGDEPWRDPVLAENRPNVVFVYATAGGGTASWGSYCESSLIARVTSLTASTVSVAVARYAQPPAGDACGGMGVGLTRLSVTLTRPLGTRTLVDANDGGARQVLDPAMVLKPSYLPPGYTGGQATWADQPAGAATRQYHGPGAELTITVGPAPLPQRAVHIVERATVREHPATVSYSLGFEQDILIAWNEDATHAANLYQTSSYDKTHPALTAEQLVRIANSLH